MRRIALMAVVVVLFLMPMFAQASITEFDIDFGVHGTGSFVYDDNDGGTDNGFTKFILDFSSIDPSLSDIQLNSAGLDFIGFASSDPDRSRHANDLFRILYSDPSHNGAFHLFSGTGHFILTQDFYLTVTGQSASIGGTTFSSPFSTVFSPGESGYGFYTSEISDFGHWSLQEPTPNPNPVPEPTTIIVWSLLGVSAIGMRRFSK
jgi:hypothetical protein